jgi:hypothetical protein
MTDKFYGTPGSLYTSKSRSYPIRQGIPLRHSAAGKARFRSEVVPEVERRIILILEGPDGEFAGRPRPAGARTARPRSSGRLSSVTTSHNQERECDNGRK